MHPYWSLCALMGPYTVGPYAFLRRVHTEAVNVYVTVPSPFSVLPLFGGDGNLNVRGSH